MKTTPIRRCAALMVALFLTVPGYSQMSRKHIEEREQLWFGFFNQTRISKRFGIWTDLHYRFSDDFASRRFQFLFRPALTYYIRDNLRLNAGYAFVHHYPPPGNATARTEHRPWQQIWWNQKYPRLVTLQWLRLEQRFNQRIVADAKTGDYNYNFRVRYNYSFFVPLKGKQLEPGTPFLALIDEVFLNFGDRILHNTFDQNRLFLGIGHQITPHLNVQAGYMNVYQQEASGTDYFSTHALRLFVFHSLDLRPSVNDSAR